MKKMKRKVFSRLLAAALVVMVAIAFVPQEPSLAASAADGSISPQAAGDITALTMTALGQSGQTNMVGNQETSVKLGIDFPADPAGSMVSFGLLSTGAIADPANPTQSELDSAVIVKYLTDQPNTGTSPPGIRLVDGIDLTNNSTGSPLAPGDYKAVVWLSLTAGGEETYYSSNNIMVVDGQGYPHNLSGSSLMVSPPNANVGTPVQFSLLLKAEQMFQTSGGSALDISIENVDFTNAVLLSPTNGILSKSGSNLQIKFPNPVVVSPTGPSVVIGNVTPIAATAANPPYIKLSDSTGTLGAASLSPLTFNSVGVSTLAPSTLTASQSYLGEATDLTLKLASNGSISAAAGSSVTLDAAGLDFTNALLPAGYTATAKSNGQLAFTIDAATNITSAGTVIAITGAMPSQAKVNAKVTLNNGAPIVTSFPVLTFTARPLHIDLVVSDGTINADASGNLTAPFAMTATVKNNLDQTVDYNGQVSFYIKNDYTALFNGNSTNYATAVNGVATLNVSWIYTSTGLNKEKTIQIAAEATPAGAKVTGVTEVGLFAQANTVSGTVTIAGSGLPLADADVTITIAEQSISRLSNGVSTTIIKPQINIVARTDANGFYTADIPANTAFNGPRATSIGIPLNTETLLYGSGSYLYYWGGDIHCDFTATQLVEFTVNAWRANPGADGPVIDHANELTKLDAGTQCGVSLYYSANQTFNRAGPYNYNYAVKDGKYYFNRYDFDTLALNNPNTKVKASLNTDSRATAEVPFTYTAGVYRYSVDMDLVIPGYVGITNTSTTGTALWAAIYDGSGRQVDRFSVEPGQFVSRFGSFYDLADKNYTVIITDPQVKYALPQFNLSDLIINPQYYQRYDGAVGLGKKIEIATQITPLTPTEIDDVTMGLPTVKSDEVFLRVLSIDGPNVTYGITFAPKTADLPLKNMGVNSIYLDVGPGFTTTYDLIWYWLTPDGQKIQVGSAPGHTGGGILSPAMPTQAYFVPKDGRLSLVLSATMTNPQDTSDRSATLYLGYSGASIPIAITKYSVPAPSITLSGENYTSGRGMIISGYTLPYQTVTFHVAGVENTDSSYDQPSVKSNAVGYYQTQVGLEMFDPYFYPDTDFEGQRAIITASTTIGGQGYQSQLVVKYSKSLPQIQTLYDVPNNQMLLEPPADDMARFGSAGPPTSIKYTELYEALGGPPGFYGHYVQTGYYNFTHATPKFLSILNDLVSVAGNNSYTYLGVWPSAVYGPQIRYAPDAGAPVVKWSPGDPLKYAVYADNCGSINKMWVTIDNGIDGEPLYLPAFRSGTSNVWLAEGVTPDGDFVPWNVHIDYTLNLGPTTLYDADGNLDMSGYFKPVADYLNQLQNAFADYTPDPLYEIDPEAAQRQDLSQVMDAMGSPLKEATYTDNGDGSVDVTLGSESSPSMTITQIPTNPATYAEVLEMSQLSGSPVFPLADGGWLYTETAYNGHNSYDFFMNLDEYLPDLNAPLTMTQTFYYCKPDTSITPLAMASSGSQSSTAQVTIQTKANSSGNFLKTLAIAALGAYNTTAGGIATATDTLFSREEAIGVISRYETELNIMSNWIYGSKCYEAFTDEERAAYGAVLKKYSYNLLTFKNEDKKNFFTTLENAIKDTGISFTASTLGNFAGRQMVLSVLSGTSTYSGATLAQLAEAGGTSLGLTVGIPVSLMLSAAAYGDGYVWSNYIQQSAKNDIELLQRINSSLSYKYMMRCGEKNRVDVPYKPNFKYDPSGFAYENGDLNKRVEGATAEIWQADDANGTNARLWTEAGEYNEVNPQYTNAEGWYAWDTPTGWWQVRLHKDGYQDAKSAWLPVLPVQLGVNLNMVKITPPPPPPGPIVNPPAPAPVTAIRSAQTTFYVVKGKTLTIPYAYDLEAGSKAQPVFTWTSSASQSVTVTQAGTVKGLVAGKSAKITVTSDNGKSKTFTVKVVKSALKTAKVSVTKPPKTLKVGQMKILKAKVTPAKATGAVVTFSLDKKSAKYIKVDKAGMVTALAKGTAKITVKAGGAKTIITIVVK